MHDAGPGDGESGNLKKRPVVCRALALREAAGYPERVRKPESLPGSNGAVVTYRRFRVMPPLVVLT
jgi:hypothetical protein